MKINLKATGIELTPAITEYAEKKIGMLDKYLPAQAEVVAQTDIGRSNKHHKSGEVFYADVHLTGAGLDVYAVCEHADLYAAIDLVKDELARKLTHEKGRSQTLARRSATAIKDMIKGFNPFRK